MKLSLMLSSSIVHVLHNCLTLILYKVLDKSISADGNPKANVAVNHKRRRREQGTEVREGGICNEQTLCGSVRISHRDALDENLGLVIEGQASVLLEDLLDVREHLQRDGQLGFDVAIIAIISVCYSAGVLVVIGEGPAPEVMNRETKHDHLEGFSLLSAGLTPGVEHVATVVVIIILLLFLQKQSLAFAVYLFGIGTLLTGLGLEKKAHVIMLSP